MVNPKYKNNDNDNSYHNDDDGDDSDHGNNDNDIKCLLSLQRKSTNIKLHIKGKTWQIKTRHLNKLKNEYTHKLVLMAISILTYYKSCL